MNLLPYQKSLSLKSDDLSKNHPFFLTKKKYACRQLKIVKHCRIHVYTETQILIILKKDTHLLVVYKPIKKSCQ